MVCCCAVRCSNRSQDGHKMYSIPMGGKTLKEEKFGFSELVVGISIHEGPTFVSCCTISDNTSYFGLGFRVKVRSLRQGSKNSKVSQLRKKTDLPEKPFENLKIEEENYSIRVADLWKPLGFTILFTSTSFVACTIWQYENLRKRAEIMVRSSSAWMFNKFSEYEGKRGTWRQQCHTYWHNLTEGQRVFAPICFLNVLVFLAWRVPRFQNTMLRYFCSNPCSSSRCLPMILSTFSHYSLLHLFINMYVLHSFSTGAVAALGKEQFVGVYLSAGVISSMASYMHKVFTSQVGRSLGASGAIMGVLGYVCSEFPDTRLAIIFLPFYTFPAGIAIKAIMGLDAAGLVAGWKFFDHAAHLGGALFGIVWCYWGSVYIWQRRQPLLEWWHEIRTKSA